MGADDQYNGMEAADGGAIGIQPEDTGDLEDDRDDFDGVTAKARKSTGSGLAL
jgi:hypothetical protein